jgi:hypothetical protein
LRDRPTSAAVGFEKAVLVWNGFSARPSFRTSPRSCAAYSSASGRAQNIERCTSADPCVTTHRKEYLSAAPAATKSTSTMIGRDWPFHVDKVSAEAGRTRVCFITSPAVRGSASIALEMHGCGAAARHSDASNRVAETVNNSAVRMTMPYKT